MANELNNKKLNRSKGKKKTTVGVGVKEMKEINEIEIELETDESVREQKITEAINEFLNLEPETDKESNEIIEINYPDNVTSSDDLDQALEEFVSNPPKFIDPSNQDDSIKVSIVKLEATGPIVTMTLELDSKTKNQTQQKIDELKAEIEEVATEQATKKFSQHKSFTQSQVGDPLPETSKRQGAGSSLHIGMTTETLMPTAAKMAALKHEKRGHIRKRI